MSETSELAVIDLDHGAIEKHAALCVINSRHDAHTGWRPEQRASFRRMIEPADRASQINDEARVSHPKERATGTAEVDYLETKPSFRNQQRVPGTATTDHKVSWVSRAYRSLDEQRTGGGCRWRGQFKVSNVDHRHRLNCPSQPEADLPTTVRC